MNMLVREAFTIDLFNKNNHKNILLNNFHYLFNTYSIYLSMLFWNIFMDVTVVLYNRHQGACLKPKFDATLLCN